MALQQRSAAVAAEVQSSRRHGSQEVHLYYPAEGFGCLYHRTMLNNYFRQLITRSNIETVAEVPLDSYGMVGAGSLVFAELGRKLTFISEDQALLNRASALAQFNRLANVRFLHAPVARLPLSSDSFDFTWSYERLQALTNPAPVIDEMCRVSKSIMIAVPNKYNYGQYAHYLYHRLSRTTCDYVGPKKFMTLGPVRQALRERGFSILQEGMIDIPWWPLFPELPNLVRRLVGRPAVMIDASQTPETKPAFLSGSELHKLRAKVEGSAVIERSPRIPRFVKSLFAHTVYALGCKPEYRRQLGL